MDIEPSPVLLAIKQMEQSWRSISERSCMVDIMAKAHLLNDEVFKDSYYNKFVAKIESNIEYQRLVRISNVRGLQITFGFSKMEDWFSIQYEVGFEICDAKGKLISVPKSSKFYDHIFNLISYFPVVRYHKFFKKMVVFTIDEEELSRECKLFADYLDEE